MYVTAHEYGPHIQNQLGTMDRADRTTTGADSDGVRLELQADCHTGTWVGTAATVEDPDRPLPQGDVRPTPVRTPSLRC